jgi:hypothetical protein
MLCAVPQDLLSSMLLSSALRHQLLKDNSALSGAGGIRVGYSITYSARSFAEQRPCGDVDAGHLLAGHLLGDTVITRCVCQCIVTLAIMSWRLQ